MSNFSIDCQLYFLLCSLDCFLLATEEAQLVVRDTVTDRSWTVKQHLHEIMDVNSQCIPGKCKDTAGAKQRKGRSRPGTHLHFWAAHHCQLDYPKVKLREFNNRCSCPLTFPNSSYCIKPHIFLWKKVGFVTGSSKNPPTVF